MAARDLCEPGFSARFLGPGIEQHDDKNEEHHHRAAINNHLRHGNKLGSQQQVKNCQRSHNTDQRQGARDGMLLQYEVESANNRYGRKDDEEDCVHVIRRPPRTAQ